MSIQAELEKLQKMSENARGKTAEAEDVVRVQLEAIRNKVKKGESTGDRLYDFTLVRMNDDLSGKVRKIFADIEKELAGKIGQLFLMAEYSRSYHDPFERHTHRGGYPMPKPHRSPDILTLGFLSDDKLVLDQKAGTWRIPSNAGPVFFKEDTDGMHYLLGKLRKQEEHPPEIVAGEENVLAFFKKELHRFTSDEEVMRRDIVQRTLGMKAPDGHWINAERDKLREESFSDALRLETKIADTRFEIERETVSRGAAAFIVSRVEDISQMIQSMRKKIDLAVLLGIDPQRTEILRMRENFGRYWEKKTPA